MFERDGKEQVVFLAGGNSLAGTPHGDILWLFSLDGTKGPVAAGGASTAVEHAGEASESKPATPKQKTGTGGNAAAGATVFAENCSVCHGANGKGGNGGPDLTSIANAKVFAKVVKQVANGGGGMPAFKGQLNDAQIDDVAAYVTQRINSQKAK